MLLRGGILGLQLLVVGPQAPHDWSKPQLGDLCGLLVKVCEFAKIHPFSQLMPSTVFAFHSNRGIVLGERRQSSI